MGVIIKGVYCTIIGLKSCALNSEFEHFILRFNKGFIILQIPMKEGIMGEGRGDRW
jgi:hypothetical protein